MFLAHFALALAAKRAAPRASLGALIAAAQWPDLLWPLLLLLGRERVTLVPGDVPFSQLRFDSYPISHSLLAVAGWALVACLVYYVARGDRDGSAVVALLVFSHWALDVVTHRPDLPMTPWGESRVGLGLWNAPAFALALELLLFAIATLLYLRGTRPRDAIGRYATWTLLAVLVVIQFASAFGPTPPSVRAVAWSTLSLWLIPLWAWWSDRHRTTSLGQ
jgi:membrane-bound metal-dependent hydrolase YbcI (DUF457 family)